MRLGKRKEKDKDSSDAKTQNVDGITRLICLSRGHNPLGGESFYKYHTHPCHLSPIRVINEYFFMLQLTSMGWSGLGSNFFSCHPSGRPTSKTSLWPPSRRELRWLFERRRPEICQGSGAKGPWRLLRPLTKRNWVVLSFDSVTD